MQTSSKKYLIDLLQEKPTSLKKEATELIKKMLGLIGENPEREGLVDTPRRVVDSWSELFEGYTIDPAKVLSTSFSNDKNYNQLVLLRDIEMFSMCEHHMLPFYGRVHIGYIPDNKVVGLSKLARLVECFSRRLQIQEQLTVQIAEAIHDHLHPKGVGVMVECQHLCMVARGVNKQNPYMVTSHFMGLMDSDESRRKEFNEQIMSRRI